MSEDKEQGVERVRVNLVPLTSTWTCPKCNYQNTHRQGIESDPQNICGVCMTKVELGAIRVSDLVQRPVVDPQRIAEIRERQEKDRGDIRAFNAVHLPTTVIDQAVADIDYLLSCIQPAGELTVEQCAFTCQDFSMHICKTAHQCVLDVGHPFDPMYGQVHEFETHLVPVKPRKQTVEKKGS